MQRTQRILAFALAGLAFAPVGCVTTDFVHPAELRALDGFDAQASQRPVRQVHNVDGQPLWFDRETTLLLDAPDQRTSGQFASIHVQDDVFAGTTADGREVRVSLSALRTAKVEQKPRKTPTVIAIGVVLSALLTGFALRTFYFEANPGGVSGRALRVKRRIVTAAAGRTRGWTGTYQPDLSQLALLSAPARAALARHWHQAALSEHASVPAFSRLSMTLMALGAPGRLVDRAHHAAREEIGHARLAFSIASAYAGTEVAPGPLTELANAPSITAKSLRALAAESLIDGCLLEGFAAAALVAAQALVADRSLRAALASIAREEASHAQFAWDIVDWCMEEESPLLGAVLVPLVERQPIPAPPAAFIAALEPEMTAHGVLASADWKRLFRETRDAVAARLERLSGQRADAA